MLKMIDFYVEKSIENRMVAQSEFEKFCQILFFEIQGYARLTLALVEDFQDGCAIAEPFLSDLV